MKNAKHVFEQALQEGENPPSRPQILKAVAKLNL